MVTHTLETAKGVGEKAMVFLYKNLEKKKKSSEAHDGLKPQYCFLKIFSVQHTFCRNCPGRDRIFLLLQHPGQHILFHECRGQLGSF